MFSIVGSCPKCGAPIYTAGDWLSNTPPPVTYSCACHGASASSSQVWSNDNDLQMSFQVFDEPTTSLQEALDQDALEEKAEGIVKFAKRELERLGKIQNKNSCKNCKCDKPSRSTINSHELTIRVANIEDMLSELLDSLEKKPTILKD